MAVLEYESSIHGSYPDFKLTEHALTASVLDRNYWDHVISRLLNCICVVRKEFQFFQV